MQELIKSLTGFFEQRGVTTLPPLDVEVPSGILAPSLFLRLFGRQPCQVTQQLVVRRPSEGRFGACDLHLVKRHCCEVLIKAAEVSGVQTLLLESLRPAGLEPASLDVQFLDLEWRDSRFGARGQGWLASLNGVPAARILFVQEAAGQSCDPPPLHLSYALEPLGFVLEDDETPDREVRGREEEELSRYYLEVADQEAAHQQLELALAEAERCLEQRLPRPAFDLLLRADHHYWSWRLRATLPASAIETWDERFSVAVRRVAELARELLDEVAGAEATEEFRHGEGAA